MQLRCLAGRYVGEVRIYSTVAGLAALRSGTAERVEAPPRVGTEELQHVVDHALTAPRKKIRRA